MDEQSPPVDPAHTPEAIALRQDMARMQADPTHPMHSAWQRRDQEAIDQHYDPQYRKVYGSGGPDLLMGQGIEVKGRPGAPARDAPPPPRVNPTAESADAGPARLSTEELAQQHPDLAEEWGEDFAPRMFNSETVALQLEADLGTKKTEETLAVLERHGVTRSQIIKLLEEASRRPGR